MSKNTISFETARELYKTAEKRPVLALKPVAVRVQELREKHPDVRVNVVQADNGDSWVTISNQASTTAENTPRL